MHQERICVEYHTEVTKKVDCFPRYGRVEKIQSDRGAQFTSPKWSEGLIKNGIQPIFSSIRQFRHPRGNIVERVNMELLIFLRTLKKKDSECEKWIAFRLP